MGRIGGCIFLMAMARSGSALLFGWREGMWSDSMRRRLWLSGNACTVSECGGSRVWAGTCECASIVTQCVLCSALALQCLPLSV